MDEAVGTRHAGGAVNYRHHTCYTPVATFSPTVTHSARLRQMDVERHLSDPALRQAYVTPMFDLIAPRYDAFTRLFSFGMDRRWKRTLLAMAAEAIPRGGVVADTATGTGDLAFAIAKVRPDVRVVATDVSLQMLKRASARRADDDATVEIAAGDLSNLPFPTGSVDAVLAGYALRNTPDWEHSIREIARVLKPGGRLLTLDFYQPAFPPWRAIFLAWLSVAGRLVGWWWHGEPMAYGYIAHSIAHFTTPAGFGRRLEASGFTVVATRSHLLGGIVIHHATRR